MPGHGRGIEHVTFFGVKVTGVLKLASDVTHLHDPPFRGSGVHVAKDGVRIEGGCGCFATAAASATTTGTASAALPAFIKRVVGISEPIKRIGKHMVLIHLGTKLF